MSQRLSLALGAAISLSAIGVLMGHEAEKPKSTSSSPTMTVTTRTGGQNKNAKADSLNVYVLLNNDENHKHRLSIKGQNAFELGKKDVFEKIKIKLPPEEITSIRLAVDGADMWKCENLDIQFFEGKKQSRLYKFEPKRYFSTTKEGKQYAPIKFMDFTLKPPVKLVDPSETDAKSGTAAPKKATNE